MCTSAETPIPYTSPRPCGHGLERVYYTIFLQGTDGMASPPACTNSHDAHARSCHLIRASRALLTEVQEVLHDARQMLARQRYRKIICAWCQQTIRWERCAQAAWGQVSHSICFDCFASMFPELAPGAALPPLPIQRTPMPTAQPSGNKPPPRNACVIVPLRPKLLSRHMTECSALGVDLNRRVCDDAEAQ